MTDLQTEAISSAQEWPRSLTRAKTSGNKNVRSSTPEELAKFGKITEKDLKPPNDIIISHEDSIVEIVANLLKNNLNSIPFTVQRPYFA